MSYWEFLLPFSVLLCALSVIRLWFRPVRRPWMVTLSVVLLFLISSDLVASFLSSLLEHRYDELSLSEQAGDAIVILSGGVDAQERSDEGLPALAHDTYLRCVQGANLFRRRPVPVVVTGRSCAPAMAHFLEAQGVIPSSIWVENASANTHENAAFSASMLRARGISRAFVVTDAKSMLRAELCFKKEGIDVVPSPVGLGSFELQISSLVPNWKAIRSNGDALHEIGGLVWYRWNGWI